MNHHPRKLASLPSLLFAISHAMLLTAIVSFSTGDAYATSWVAPIGIPMPPFGVNEVVPTVPSPWSGAKAGFYYVCPTCPGATDSSNPLGYPGQPRLTIPSTVTGPATIFLNGQINSDMSFTGNGTASAPIFVTSYNASSPAHLTTGQTISGSYVILDHLWYGPRDSSSTDFGFGLYEGTHHITIRNSEFAGNKNRSGGIGLGTWGYTGSSSASYIVIDNNSIHNLGDTGAASDQDAHCVVINGTADHVWVTYNTLQYCSGDAIQVEAQDGRRAFIHHIYYGKNVAHHNRQSGGWVKNATDVIFSQNIAHDFRDNSGGPGVCFGFQYGPEYVWFLFNEGYFCNIGIGIAGNSNSPGQNSFIIGNIIHDTQSQSPTDPYNAGAMVIRGGTNVYVVNNTMYNVDAGVNMPPGTSKVFYYDNIISQRTNPSTYDLYTEGSVALDVKNSIFSAAGPRFTTGNGTYTTVAQFQSATGTGQGCSAGDPKFLNAGAQNFSLQATSPAIDSGMVASVYSTFLSRYGIDISKDIAGTTRPQGNAYDIGAYEFVSNSLPNTQPPTAPSSLQVTSTVP